MVLYRMRLIVIVLLLVAYGQRAAAQKTANDGFLRLNGTMYILRNGDKLPMEHDVHLPNGRTVTHDGFVIAADGNRTELSEGQGCTLSGLPSRVVTSSDGQLVLQASGAGTPQMLAFPAGTGQVPEYEVRQGHRGRGYYKKHGKQKHKKHDD
ncbi:DUF6799 domain-containing protein [Hymenobacter sp. BT491]|uniref:DUF6799 domain-containing protein n=1 Tax=Hymenobacter sp. BT491 TaxID=2766779 RepID=UPI001653A7E5|nr:DUF6799 domain-containing protein [Hymenobacter sp. BT491]MBC6991179.1 hypothetical protein [Hymenobacter sp. BT491]